MRKFGFRVSRLHPAVYYNPDVDIWAVCHVDDILLLGPRNNLVDFKGKLDQIYDITGEILEEGCEIKYLGRTIGRDSNGYYWHGDSKHVETLISELGMHDCNEVGTPYWKEVPHEERDREPDLPSSEATTFRRHAARVSYLSQDRFDLCVAANMLSRCMATPKPSDMISIKRVVRYLKGTPQLITRYDWQASYDYVSMTDSDWASCKKTRRSTSGGTIYRGRHILSYWCKLQGSVARSSGEAERPPTLASRRHSRRTRRRRTRTPTSRRRRHKSVPGTTIDAARGGCNGCER